MLKKWFGNDKDGFSLQDFIATGAFVVWLLISIYFAYFAVTRTLVPIQIDFYRSFIWLPTTVVGGVFGVRAIGGAMGRYQTNKQSQYYQSNNYGEVNGYDYNNGPPI